MKRAFWIGALCAALLASTVAAAQSQGPAYRVKDEVVVFGKVTSVTTIPDWMGKDGVNLALDSPDAALPHVDVATASFLKLVDFPIAVGDDLRLRGCWGRNASGAQVFLVHEMTKQKVSLNVRDDRGAPIW